MAVLRLKAVITDAEGMLMRRKAVSLSRHVADHKHMPTNQPTQPSQAQPTKPNPTNQPNPAQTTNQTKPKSNQCSEPHQANPANQLSPTTLTQTNTTMCQPPETTAKCCFVEPAISQPVGRSVGWSGEQQICKHVAYD